MSVRSVSGNEASRRPGVPPTGGSGCAVTRRDDHHSISLEQLRNRAT